MSFTKALTRFLHARKCGTDSIIERARHYIAKCSPAISGQHGHDATYRVAAILWNGFGLSETEALALLSEYNQRCRPPWREAELIHKVRSVANARHAEARGYMAGKGRKGEGRTRNHHTLPSPSAPD